jgi:hypothetical protein
MHATIMKVSSRRVMRAGARLLPAAGLFVLSSCGGGGGPPAIIPVVPTPPSVTTQPVPVSVTTGQPASFSVTASGTAPLSYQWQKNAVDIGGAIAATYSIAATALADNGAFYRVVVSNAASTVTSTAVLLTVTAPNVTPSITTPPVGARVTAPATASFTVVASGTPAPTLQWQVSTDLGSTWTNIAGATAATYTTPATTIADSDKRFRVIATNVAGSATSPFVLLIVDPPVVADKLVVFAGSIGSTGTADGPATTARFSMPYGMAIDAAGNVYTSDRDTHTIRKITPAGVVSTLAGLANAEGSADGTGSAARFSFPEGLDVDAAGNVYVADFGNQLLRKITPAGVVTTVRGILGQPGGPLNGSKLFSPSAVAVDAAGNFYLANTGDQTIVMYPASGPGVLLAGYPGRRGSKDGADTAALFNGPSDLKLDGLGNLYIADQFNHTIRKLVIATHVVTTYAGTPAIGGFADGTGVAAKFADPIALTIDATGNMYVADFTNNVLRKIAPGGVVTTVLGVVRSDPSFEFRTGPDPRLGLPLYMAMIDSKHIVLGMATANHAVYIATVP